MVTDWKDSLEFSVNFPQPCVHTALCTINGEVTMQEAHFALSFFKHLVYLCIQTYCVSLQEHLVGLTERAHLYIGNTAVCMTDLKLI